MAHSTKDSPQTVSLEELLRFKRAERPDQAFWEQFDNELHQRMLQTLVKKDPWYIQIFRGLTGKIAQTTAISAAAALLALMVIRPALVMSDEQSQLTGAVLAEAPIAHEALTKPAEEKMPSSSPSESPVVVAKADYSIESLTASTKEGINGVTKEFGLDHIDVASYDRSVYTADMALPGFASTGVASIVY